MLSIRETNILEKIIEHSNRITEKIINKTIEQFTKNLDLIEIICFNILQIGELVAHLSNEFLKTYDKVPWSQVTGMRNIVVHGYGTVKLNRVYKTAINDVPVLLAYCKKILLENSK